MLLLLASYVCVLLMLVCTNVFSALGTASPLQILVHPVSCYYAGPQYAASS